MAWSLIEEASETWQGWYFVDTLIHRTDRTVPKRSLQQVGLLESKVMFPAFRTNRINRMGLNHVKSKVWLLMLPWWRPRSLPLDCPVYWRRGGVLTWYKKIPVAYFMRGLLVALWLFAGKLALTTWCATCSLFKFHLSWQKTHENIWLNLTLMRTNYACWCANEKTYWNILIGTNDPNAHLASLMRISVPSAYKDL